MGLNEPVGLVTFEAGLDEGEQDPLAEDEAVRVVEIAAHPGRVDDEAVDQPVKRSSM